MTRFSITAALILGTAVMASAADDLASAFKDGKLEGRLRAQYFYTNWDDDAKDNASGMAVGGSLIYKTAPLYGFSAGAGLYTTQNPGGFTDVEDGITANTSKDLFARGPGSAYEYGQGYAVLAQAYLQYDIEKSKIKAGRFLMTNPWTTPNDTKMIPIAIQGIDAVSNDVPNTTIQFDVMDQIKERGMDTFENMASTLDTPTKISNYYDTGYGTATVRHGKAPDVFVAGVKNHTIDNLELQAWGMHWNDLIDQIRLEANYAFEAGDTILGFGALYLQQFDQGAGDIIKPHTSYAYSDSDDKVDTYLYALRATANYRAAKLLVAYSHTDDDGDIIAPWRGFPTQGYTRSMTVTDWGANTDAYKVQLDYDFDTLVPGLSSFISYSFYDRDPNKRPYQSMTNRGYQNGDTKQWNWDTVYKFGGTMKGLEVKARLMDQNNEKTALVTSETSNREMRLEANYRF